MKQIRLLIVETLAEALEKIESVVSELSQALRLDFEITRKTKTGD